MPDPVKQYYKKMSKHDEDILKLQSNIDKTNLQLQNKLYKDIQAVNKPRKVIKRIKNPENDKTLQQQINDDKYIELNDKLASTIRDELKGKIIDATTYPLTLGDNVNDSYKQLKKNMNNIMTNPGNIELIINSFSVEEIKKLNNNWESIQKKYISKYGFNNPNLTIKEIKEYLLSEMGQSNKSVDDKSIEEVKKKMMEESQKVNDNIKEINKNILLFRNTIDGLHKNKKISLVDYQQKIQDVKNLEDNLNVLDNLNLNLQNDLQKLKEELQMTKKEALRDIEGIKNQSKPLEQANKELYDFAINEKKQNILLQNKLNIIEEEYNEVVNKNNEIKDQSDSLKDEIITDKDKKKNQQNENEEAINKNDLMEQQMEQKDENENDLIEQKMEQKDENKNDLIEQKMEQKDENENDLIEQKKEQKDENNIMSKEKYKDVINNFNRDDIFELIDKQLIYLEKKIGRDIESKPDIKPELIKQQLDLIKEDTYSNKFEKDAEDKKDIKNYFNKMVGKLLNYKINLDNLFGGNFGINFNRKTSEYIKDIMNKRGYTQNKNIENKPTEIKEEKIEIKPTEVNVKEDPLKEYLEKIKIKPTEVKEEKIKIKPTEVKEEKIEIKPTEVNVKEDPLKEYLEKIKIKPTEVKEEKIKIKPTEVKEEKIEIKPSKVNEEYINKIKIMKEYLKEISNLESIMDYNINYIINKKEERILKNIQKNYFNVYNQKYNKLFKIGYDNKGIIMKLDNNDFKLIYDKLGNDIDNIMKEMEDNINQFKLTLYIMLFKKKLENLDIAINANENNKNYVKIEKNDDYNILANEAEKLVKNIGSAKEFNDLLSEFDVVINKYKQNKEEEASTEATENPQMEEIDIKYSKITPLFSKEQYVVSFENTNYDMGINKNPSSTIRSNIHKFISNAVINISFFNKITALPYYYYYIRYNQFLINYFIKKLVDGKNSINDDYLSKIEDTIDIIKDTYENIKIKKNMKVEFRIYDSQQKKLTYYECKDGIFIFFLKEENKNSEPNYDENMLLFEKDSIMTLDFNNEAVVTRKRGDTNYKFYQPFPDYKVSVRPNLSNNMYGSGLDKKDNFINLGENLMINKKKLINDNVLSLVDGNKRKIALYKNTKISDNLVDIILKILDNSKIKNTDLNNLNENERLLYTSLLRRAALHKKYDINVDDTIEKIKYKYKLLEGEINSGNNNPQLINDMRDILRKMVNFKLISQNTANNYFKQVKSINK